MSEVDRVAIRARLNAAGTELLADIGLRQEDMEVIAHAHADLEALLELADDLEKEVQRLRERPSVAELHRALSDGAATARHSYRGLARAVLALFPTVEGGDTRD